MSCREMRGWIVDDLVGALSAADRSALEEHLAGCAECAEEARQVRQLWGDLAEAATLRSPTEGLDRLQARVAEEFGAPAASGPGRARGLWTVWVQRAALAVVVALGSFLLGQRLALEPETPPEESAKAPHAEAPEDVRPRFALLFYEIAGDDELKARASEEIGNWARELFRGGVVEDGEEMYGPPAFAGDPGADVADRIWGAPRVTHVIWIRAESLEAAREVAATAPTTAYGGVIEVRPLDD